MVLLLIPLIAALAPIIGAGLGGLFGAKGQKNANTAAQDSAREQMAFQERMANSAQSFSERMANTAMQRRVADLNAAGLNPALAYENAAAAPTGVTAGGASSTPQNVMRDLPQIASTAMQLRNMAQQMKINQGLANAQGGLLSEQSRKTRAEADLVAAQKGQLEANQPYMNKTMAAEAAIRQAMVPGYMNQAEFEKMLNEKMRGGGATAKGIFQLINSLRGLIKD